MSFYYTDMLNQTAVHWAKQGIDGFGAETYGSPSEISVRWVTKNELFLNDKGVEEISNAIVSHNTTISVGDWLYLGELVDVSGSDPVEVDSAYKVKQIKNTPDIIGSDFVKKVIL